MLAVAATGESSLFFLDNFWIAVPTTGRIVTPPRKPKSAPIHPHFSAPMIAPNDPIPSIAKKQSNSNKFIPFSEFFIADRYHSADDRERGSRLFEKLGRVERRYHRRLRWDEGRWLWWSGSPGRAGCGRNSSESGSSRRLENASFFRTAAATLPAGKIPDRRNELFIEHKTHREKRVGHGA